MTFWKNVAWITRLSEHARCHKVALPEAPLARFHDPNSEEKIGCRVRKDAGGKASRAPGDEVVNRSCNDGYEPIRARVREPENHGYRDEREYAERAERNLFEIFADEKTQ